MATPLEHATWFFDSAWGDGIVGIGVPIASAGLAAALVIRQIRAASATRELDRRAEAVAILSEYVSDIASLPLDERRFRDAQLHRFNANARLARAYGLLGRENRIVGQWVATEVAHITQMTNAWAARVVAEGADPWTGMTGHDRAEIVELGAQVIQNLLQWMNQDIDLEWFALNKRSLPPGTRVAEPVVMQATDPANPAPTHGSTSGTAGS